MIDFKEIVDKRFPGLKRLLSNGELGAYMLLGDFINTETIDELQDNYPDLYEYLEFDDPDPDILPGPSSRSYQAIADLFQVVMKIEWDIEEMEIDDDDDISLDTYPLPPE